MSVSVSGRAFLSFFFRVKFSSALSSAAALSILFRRSARVFMLPRRAGQKKKCTFPSICSRLGGSTGSKTLVPTVTTGSHRVGVSSITREAGHDAGARHEFREAPAQGAVFPRGQGAGETPAPEATGRVPHLSEICLVTCRVRPFASVGSNSGGIWNYHVGLGTRPISAGTG